MIITIIIALTMNRAPMITDGIITSVKERQQKERRYLSSGGLIIINSIAHQ